MLLKTEKRDSRNMIGVVSGVAEINRDYRNHELFRNWLENCSGSSTKKLRRLIKKKVTVQDWKRYVDRRCLSYHIRGCCNTMCQKSNDHKNISGKEARLLLDFCQSVENKPSNDGPLRKEASPTSVSGLSTYSLRYHHTGPKMPERDARISEGAASPKSVDGLNTNALCYHYTY